MSSVHHRPVASGTPPGGREGGFTLTEMMVAMGILTFAATSLIGVLAVGVSTRRESELRGQATRMADAVVHHLSQEVLADVVRQRIEADDPDVRPETVVVENVPGYPGLVYTVNFQTDPEHPDLVLASVVLSWRAQGEARIERFRRVLRVEEPFPTRVGRRLNALQRTNR